VRNILSSTTNTNLDKVDQEILAYTVSDDALEMAGDTGRMVAMATIWPFCTMPTSQCEEEVGMDMPTSHCDPDR
jgi:hypothetical protein